MPERHIDRFGDEGVEIGAQTLSNRLRVEHVVMPAQHVRYVKPNPPLVVPRQLIKFGFTSLYVPGLKHRDRLPPSNIGNRVFRPVNCPHFLVLIGEAGLCK